MKSIAWAIVIAMAGYFLAIEPAKRNAINAAKAEVSSYKTDQNVQPTEPAAYRHARGIANESKNRGSFPRRVAENITMTDVKYSNNTVIYSYVFDQPSSIPLSKNEIAAAREDIITKFKYSQMCTHPEMKQMLRDGLIMQQIYFLKHSSKPAFIVSLDLTQC